MVDSLVALVPTIGPISILIAFVIFVIWQPEKTEKIAGWLLGLFNFGIKKLRQRSIKSSIQGGISTFARSMNEQVNGIMPYNVRLNFVKELDRTELDPDKQIVIVRIRDNLDDERNLVHSMMAFCSIGVVPQARQFLPKSMNAAIDVTVTRKLLNDLKHYGALQYLYEEVLTDGDDEGKAREEFCRMFDVLDESGLFTRVFLEEMRDFGSRISTRYPRDWHGEEAAQFVRYIHAVATRLPGHSLQEVGHRGYYISTAFVFVGSPETMSDRGEEAYLSHVRFLRTRGYRRVYLTARGGSQFDTLSRHSISSLSIDMARQVSQSIEREGIGTIGRTMEYHTPDTMGNERQHVLIEIDIS